MNIIDFCRNVSIRLNLFDLIILLFALLLVTIVLLIVRKMVLAIKTERKIDERLRETRAKISRVVTEIEEYKDSTTELELEKVTTTVLTQAFDELTTEFVMETLSQTLTKETKPWLGNDTLNTNPIEEKAHATQEVSEIAPKGKKTRAMSMEERWAEYDKKRAMRNTA